jgi:hypothetical protein
MAPKIQRPFLAHQEWLRMERNIFDVERPLGHVLVNVPLDQLQYIRSRRLLSD